MSSKHIWALALIGLVTVVLIKTGLAGGKVEVDLLIKSVKSASALVLLAFTAVGVVIGILFK
jgi:hypothetical protein